MVKNMKMSKINLFESTDEDDLNFYVKSSATKKLLSLYKLLDYI